LTAQAGQEDRIKLAERCARCGRRLSNPLSQQHGMGPVCFAKAQAETQVDQPQLIMSERGENDCS
jgi:hypothetical protein